MSMQFTAGLEYRKAFKATLTIYYSYATVQSYRADFTEVQFGIIYFPICSREGSWQLKICCAY